MRNLFKYIYCGRKEKWILRILCVNIRRIMRKFGIIFLIFLILYSIYNL